MGTGTAVGAVPLLLVIWLVGRAWSWATPERVRAWAALRGLELDPAGMAHLHTALRTTRRARAAGWGTVLLVLVLLPWLAPTWPVLGGLGADGVPWGGVLAGYAVGLVAGELRRDACRTGARGRAPGRASLVVRETRSYDRRAADAQLLAAVCALLASAGAAVLAVRTASTQVSAIPRPTAWELAPLLACAGGVVVEVARRWVAGRPVPAPTGDVAVAEDVVRAHVLGALRSVQVAWLLLAAGALLLRAAAVTSSAVLRPVVVVGGLAAPMVAALVLIAGGPRLLHVPSISRRRRAGAVTSPVGERGDVGAP